MDRHPGSYLNGDLFKILIPVCRGLHSRINASLVEQLRCAFVDSSHAFSLGAD
jgi:hypothetical protein